MIVCGVEFDRPYNTNVLLDKIGSYRKEDDTFIQIFNHEKVVGEEHLIWAYEKAVDMIDKNNNRADSLEIETLLWASAEWQIKDAIKTMGVPEDSDKTVITIDEDPERFIEEMNWERNDDIFEPSVEKLKRFGISDEEIKSVSNPYDLIFEKMAASVL